MGRLHCHTLYVDERRKAKYPPRGCSFVSCNWVKQKSKLVSPDGQLKFLLALMAETDTKLKSLLA
jgi:hypothetical protein